MDPIELSDAVITVLNVSKRYTMYGRRADRLKEALWPWSRNLGNAFHALDDVSFRVKKGETLALIGQNGSGKSTLLKIITGVLSATSGTLEVNGRISALLELGAGFHPDLSGIDNIYLNGIITGLTKEEVDANLQEILSFADIGEHIHQPVKTYSSGMFVRLAFATAINVDPDILIVDEALSVGDMFFQLKCYRKFDEFKAKGKTILFVTHDLGTVIKNCDRAIVLQKGRVIGSGTPREMVDLYKKSLVSGGNSSAQRLEISPDANIRRQQWSDSHVINPNLESYGNGFAEIGDFGVFDHEGCPSDTVAKGETCAFKMHVRFFEDISNPIFAFTIKDKKGTEICGSNTVAEGASVPAVKQGESFVIEFCQIMSLHGGQYFLSLGCTGFNRSGEFVVYHRLYDVISFQVVSIKDTVGFFDLNSTVNVYASNSLKTGGQVDR